MTDEQLMFPETLYKLYLVNVPPAFMIVWKVVSSVIDARVLEKIKLLGTDFLDEMLKDIDIEQIPQRYGGKAKWKVRWGDVPISVFTLAPNTVSVSFWNFFIKQRNCALMWSRFLLNVKLIMNKTDPEIMYLFQITDTSATSNMMS